MIKKLNTSLNIAYIGGGSRAWAWTFMTDLALEPELGGVIRLYDIDANAAKNNEIIGNRFSSLPQSKGKWKYVTNTNLQETLIGVDFVIISILPGTLEQMKSDVHLPEQLGIYQSVGDTTGPGGMIRSLRTVPMFVEFAEAIRSYAPDAWVINYTNPMSICLRTLYHTFPKIKALGCCHEVFSAQMLLAAMVKRYLGVEHADRNEIHVNVLGINHFTWFNHASYRNYDLFDMYVRFVDEFYEKGFQIEEPNLQNKSFTCTNRVKFDLFKRFGWIAAAGDRHLAEFMPGNTYLKNIETIEGWGFYLTSVQWRIEDLKRRLAKSVEMISSDNDINLIPSGEEGILLIKALCGITRVVSNVNLPNTERQISNLPTETVVETNALFSHDSERPIAAGSLSCDIHKLIQPHADNQTDILQAALHCDKDAVYRAFERDPLVSGRITEKEIRKLADEMITNTMDYLPKDWL